uniref:RING-type E3 ubiquitin transferase n=1 Tax=Kalanchoe fedtschenkoi TaxID=63787 RepID=A0A7N0V5E2_KALFE
MEDDDQHRQPPPRHTYWCYECDLSVSLPASLYPLCPHCRNDFLEHMEQLDSSQQLPSIPNPNSPDHNRLNLADDSYRLFIQQSLNHPDAPPNPTFLSTASAPTSKPFVEALPSVKVPMSDEADLLCAICKDQFLADVEAKQLPCTHLYHSDCILPWLAQHNSCPVCRFKLPVEERSGNGSELLQDAVGVRFWELMESEDMHGFGSTLRHIARRHRNIYSGGAQGSMDSFISPTQMAGAEAALVGPANSVETVSSTWHLERGVDSSRTNGNGNGGDVGLREDEDGDGVASGI